MKAKINAVLNWIVATFLSWRALVTFLIIATVFGTYVGGRQHGVAITERHTEVAVKAAVMEYMFIEQGKQMPASIVVSVNKEHSEVSEFSWWCVLGLACAIITVVFITFLRMLLGAFEEGYKTEKLFADLWRERVKAIDNAQD